MLALETDAEAAVTAKDMVEYHCDRCPNTAIAPTDSGLPEDWEMFPGTIESNGKAIHVCNVCLAPIKPLLYDYRMARMRYIDVCKSMAKGLVTTEVLVKGLVYNREEEFV